MFFAVDLLLPQHRGRFSNVWLAATRGVRFVKITDIRNCDIAKICDDIAKLVNSSSTRPRLRLSLSLSSRLINGTLKIYKKQVELTLEDIIMFLTTVRAPAIIQELNGIDQPTPEVVIKRKKRPPVLSLPTLSQPTPEQEPLVRNIDEITLREVDVIPSVPKSDDLFGFGTLLEDALPEIPAVAPVPTLVPEIPEVTPVPMLQDETPRAATKRKFRTTEIDAPSKKRAVPDKADRPIEQPVEAAPVQQVAEIELPQTVEPPPVQARVTPQPSPVTPRQPVRQPPADKHLIKLQSSRIVRIDKPKLQLFDYKKYCNYVRDPIVAEKKIPNTSALLSFVLDDEDANIDMQQLLVDLPKRLGSLSVRGSSLFTSSVTSVRPRTTSSTPSEPLIPLVQPEIVVQPEIPIQVELPMVAEQANHLEEIIPELRNGNVEMPPQLLNGTCPVERVSLPPDRTFEAPAVVAGKIQLQKEAIISVPFISSQERNIVSTKQRLKVMRKIIKEWDEQVQGDMMIDDVCPQPINRFNVARAFSDLLSLVYMGYVKLNNQPDSLELGTIEKGPKFFK